MDFKEKYGKYLEKVNEYLEKVMTDSDCPEAIINEAMRYSIFAGGKRMRPVLMLAAADILDVSHEVVLPFAAALEMIHTYSLIHDDLPSMDNDDYRRGKKTSHKVYGEAIAILAGDALLTYAFEVAALSPGEHESVLKAIGALAGASGRKGMIAGQVVDIESEGKEIELKMLRYMHSCKTGALINAATEIPAILGKVDSIKRDAINKYAKSIGIAFQIKDDILDVEGDFTKLGKPIGSDRDSSKSTYTKLLGLKESKRLLDQHIKESIDALKPFERKSDFLKDIAIYIGERES